MGYKKDMPTKCRMGKILCSPHSIEQLHEELRLLLKDKSISSRTVLCVNSHIFNLAPGTMTICEAF